MGSLPAFAPVPVDLKPVLKLLLLIVCFCALVGDGQARDFYVSPQGGPHGNGKAKKPWDLQTALSHPAMVNPGDVIWLRGGTYRGNFVSRLTGTAAAPIVVRQFPGERAVLDGNWSTTLAADLPATQRSFPVADGSNLLPGTVLHIDSEDIQVGAASANTVTIANRGWGGTTPAPHSAGARLTVYGNTLTVNGAYAWYWGFEVTDSDPARSTTVAGSAFSQQRGQGVWVAAPNTKLINLVIHDAADGIGFWRAAVDSEVYGCLLFNNGVSGPDRGHGHGVYIQNETGIKRITDVISFNNFATGMKAFGETGPAVGVHFEGVISFNNGSPWTLGGAGSRQPDLFAGTGEMPADDIRIRRCYTYQPTATAGGGVVLGYVALNNGRAELSDSVVVVGGGVLQVTEWQSVTATGNQVHATGTALAQVRTASAGVVGYNWDRNRYYDLTLLTGGLSYPFGYNNARNALGGGRLRFAEWQAASGYDVASQYQYGGPTGAEVYVRPNRYEPGRAHVAVYNWDKASFVDLDLSAVLQVGATYEIRNAQDFLAAPLSTGVYDGKPVRVPMTGLSVAPVIGHNFTPAATGPEFNAFVVITR